MRKYIHQLTDWPHFKWDEERINPLLVSVRHRQGLIIGRMDALGFLLKEEAILKTLTLDVTKSSEIEGEYLDTEQVRSSIARHLGMDIAGLVWADRNVDGIVELMLDATQNYDQPLTDERLFVWQTSLFPGGRSGLYKITTGMWRTSEKGPMQVVSGPVGKEKVHFEAPNAERVPEEMQKFIEWFNSQTAIDPVIKAAIAHYWFVTIHPFDDGNGRIGRAIADMQLARADGSPQRFYSMSSQIRLERNEYYRVLEKTSNGSLDISDWIIWFLNCLNQALLATEDTLSLVHKKAKFWNTHSQTSLNERQKLMLNKMLEGFEGKLTSSKWAKITKSSQDTALRDIQNLIDAGILIKDASGGRSTSYLLF